MLPAEGRGKGEQSGHSARLTGGESSVERFTSVALSEDRESLKIVKFVRLVEPRAEGPNGNAFDASEAALSLNNKERAVPVFESVLRGQVV